MKRILMNFLLWDIQINQKYSGVNMENIKVFTVLASLLVVLLIVGNLFWENPEQRFESTQEMMDTYVTISLYHNNEERAKEIIQTAFDKINDIILIASRFDPSSELYKLNMNSMIENPSPELLDMIKTSVDYYNITDGAFDITILPLLNLWNDDKDLLTINNSFEQELNNEEFSESLKKKI